MTPDQNARLLELVPLIAQLDALALELAEVEAQYRHMEDLLAPWARQMQWAEQTVQRLRGMSWASLAASFMGNKQQRLTDAKEILAKAQQQIAGTLAKLEPLRNEVETLEARIAPLKPFREEHERLVRMKENWVQKQTEDARQHLQRLRQQEDLLYRAFIALDPALIAVQRAQSAFQDLFFQLDREKHGGIGREVVPLLKNLREILMGFGAAYMRELNLIDRCYAFAAQSARLMLEQNEERTRLEEQLRQLEAQIAADFVNARTAWQDVQRERIQYVESYPVT